MEDRIEEILARLEALERRLGPPPPEPRSEGGPRSEERGGVRCSFCEEERRIVDLIVRLTTDNVARVLDERLRRMPPAGPPPPPGPPPGWGHPPRGPHGHGR